jgi:hypothetical protein
VPEVIRGGAPLHGLRSSSVGGTHLKLLRATKRALGIAVIAAAGLALSAAPAHAQPVTTGSLAFNGDPGDYISGGRPHSYSTGAGDVLSVNSNEGYLSVSVTGHDGAWWSLDLAASSGQTLAVGTYLDAHRYPFQGSGPGLDISGDGRGCNQLTGSFEIQKLVSGPNGYVEALDATYEQHCEGGTDALRGEVHIVNAPAPKELQLGLEVSTSGQASSLNGKATVSGTVACTSAAKVTVSGMVTQVKKRVLIRGTYTTQVDCTPGAPVAWTATADPTGTTPYQKGLVEVVTTGTAEDPVYLKPVSVTTTTVVTLKKA